MSELHPQAPAGAPGGTGGQWVIKDGKRGQVGQVLDTLNTARANHDEDAAERAQMHLVEATVEEIADIAQRNGVDKFTIYRPSGSEPWELENHEAFSDEDAERICELLESSDLSGVHDVADQSYFDVRADSAPGEYLAGEYRDIAVDRLRTRAANSDNWAISADQDSLFEVETPEFTPTQHLPMMDDRDPDDVVGRDLGVGELRVRDFEDQGNGIYRHPKAGRTLLDPWKNNRVPADMRHDDGLYYDSELDDVFPYEPAGDGACDRLNDAYQKRAQGLTAYYARGKSTSPNENFVRRAISVDKGDRTETLDRLAVARGDATTPVSEDDWNKAVRETPDQHDARVTHRSGLVRLSAERNSFIPQSIQQPNGTYRLSEVENYLIATGPRTNKDVDRAILRLYDEGFDEGRSDTSKFDTDDTDDERFLRF